MNLQTALAIVEARFPEENRVSVQLPNLAGLTATKARIASFRAGSETTLARLPEVGEVGIVIFTHNTTESAVWIASVPSDIWNVSPTNLFASDPDAEVSINRAGVIEINYGNGDKEVQHPDGSFMRITHSDASNFRNKRTLRQTVDAEPENNSRIPEQRDYVPTGQSNMIWHFEHPSGTVIRLERNGTINMVAQGTQISMTNQSLRVERQAGGIIVMEDGEVRINIFDQEILMDGAQLRLSDALSSVTLLASGIIVESNGDIRLGEGIAQAARVSDPILVSTTVVTSSGTGTGSGQGFIQGSQNKVYV